MTNHKLSSVSILLSPTQVDEVVRAASHGRAPSVATLIASSLHEPLEPENGAKRRRSGKGSSAKPGARRQGAVLGGYLPIDSVDPRLSQSLVRGLSLLTCFDSDGTERGIVELAGDLDMSPSTAHRYALTLVELGLLERCPTTRKYRLPGS